MLIKEASQTWNISTRRIRKLIELGRINASKLGNTWIIPNNTPKPLDKRYKNTQDFTCTLNTESIKELNNKLSILKKTKPNTNYFNLKNNIDLEIIYQSNKINGNTLTKSEVITCLNGLTVPNKTIREHLEILNYHKAIKYLEKEPLNLNTILETYNILTYGLNIDNNLRNNEILPKLNTILDSYTTIDNIYLKASYLYSRILELKPFNLSNGLLSRLLLNKSLIDNGLSPIIITYAEHKPITSYLYEIFINQDYTNLTNYLLEKENQILDEYLKIINF